MNQGLAGKGLSCHEAIPGSWESLQIHDYDLTIFLSWPGWLVPRLLVIAWPLLDQDSI